MTTKLSIHIKPRRVTSSRAHNRRAVEHMYDIDKSKIYIIPELTSSNEQRVSPGFGSPDLQAHCDSIKRMVREKTGRAMQEKKREHRGKDGKIIKVAGCSSIREGVLLIRPDTTLTDIRKFGEECQRRWGITPLQTLLYKDEGYWLSGRPRTGDRESFQVSGKWLKPNYHAYIVFDWMNRGTGRSQKLDDDGMMGMQILVSDILSMQRGQSKSETGKEHLERNDFTIEKQRAGLQRMDAAKRHREERIGLAEQELKQMKSEVRTNKLKKTVTNAVTAIVSGVDPPLGGGEMKELERTNEDLHQKIAKRDRGVDTLKIQMQGT